MWKNLREKEKSFFFRRIAIASRRRCRRRRTEKKTLLGDRRPPSQALLPRPRPRQPLVRRLLRRPARFPTGHGLGSFI